MSNSNSSSGGIGVLGLLGVAFVVLKLTDVIDWSWWLVTLPFWVGIPIIFLFFIGYAVYAVWEGERKKRANPKA